MPATQPSACSSRLLSPPIVARRSRVSSSEKRRSSAPSGNTAPSITSRVMDSAGASRVVMTTWPFSGRSRIRASTALMTSSASPTRWKSSRTTMTPAGAWARSLSSNRASPTPSAPSSRPRRNSGTDARFSKPRFSKPASNASASRVKSRLESRSVGSSDSQTTAAPLSRA